MQDDDFARALRDRLDAVAPRFEIDTTRVVPRARRHRTTVRSVGVAASVVALVAGGWFADARPWTTHTSVAPAATAETSAASNPSVPTPEPSTSPSPDAAAPATWWYERWETDGGARTDEQWWSRTEYGLGVTNGDLSTADEFEPMTSIGAFRIDGVMVQQLSDPALLPTDPDELLAVLRASAQPGVRSGSDDDKAFEMAKDLLERTGLIPEDLRRAAWEAASRLPGATLADDQVISGRTVEVLVHESSTGEYMRLARDPATGLLTAISTSPDDGWPVVAVEQRAVTSLPRSQGS